MIIDLEKRVGKFPTTRYQGSKRKLLKWIYDALKDIKFHSVLDAFGGTASVSYLLKAMNKEVTYNDYLRFNSIIGKSIIENSFVTLSDVEVNRILKENISSGSFITDTFRDIYYVESENVWLDNVISSLDEIEYCTEGEFKKAIAYNALYQSCLIKRPFNLFHRKNLNIRLNDVKRNFGNKATWEKEFSYFFKKFISEVNNSIFNTGQECYSINKDVFDLDTDYDLVYLDPPYVLNNSRNESANYLRSYHFLEGISDYNNWKKNIDYDTSILNLRKDYLPNYFKSSVVQETFSRLIEKFKDSKIVISYKYGGNPSVEFIVDLLKKYDKNVITYSRHYKYALNKQNGNAKLNREYLIIGI
jgi:adenine-specific DNA-methyltransferase